MSVAEIKAAIDALSAAELEEVAAYLRRKRWEDTPEWRAELSRSMDEMDAGKKVSLAELKRRHADRVIKGE